MALVGYSDSEGSSDEQTPAPKATAKASASTKPLAFQKVIDRSNPHKIRVTLPDISQAGPIEVESDDIPPAKRAKVGGGAFSGFNALLPAPKLQTVSNGGTSTGLRRGGIGSGINLITGATPGFSREPMPAPSYEAKSEGNTLGEDGGTTSTEALETLRGTGISSTTNLSEQPKVEPKKQGNPMMFKPLSVARKPQKKKPNVAAVPTVQPVISQGPGPLPKAASRISLFSMAEPEKEDTYSIGGSGAYQPLVYQASTTNTTDETAPSENTSNDGFYTNNENTTDFLPPSSIGTEPGPQSLDSIASDLNLSASARRQLLGRQRNNTKGNPAAINVVNFNTDQEYAANELLRQAGEHAMHNPVKALASGKHSLKQLVNAASSQKDALEEHFASGRRNKKEAGSKYGW